jgi:hypothetical protein
MSSEFSPSFQSIIDCLDAKEFTYESNPVEKRVTLRLTGKNANYRIVARITRDGDYFQVFAFYPLFVKEEKLRVSCAELITRANYNMKLGHFEMDMKDGEIRFHLTHMIDAAGLSFEVVDRFIMTSYFTMDRYFPALMQHIHAGYTPEDAIFHSELDFHAEAVVEEPKKPKKQSGSKSVSKSSAKKEKLPAPEAQNADSELPTPSSEAPSETPVVHKDTQEDQNQGERPIAGGEGISGQGELPL